MRRFPLNLLILIIVFSFAGGACKNKQNARGNTGSEIPFDSTLVTRFFKTYPELGKYEKDLVAIYRSNGFSYIWFDKKGIIEYGNSLYSKVKAIETEGISTSFPYQEKIDGIFTNDRENRLTNTDAEMLLTSLYVYYADKVYKGIDTKTTKAIGWLLPRKKVSYTILLDSMISDQKLPDEDSLTLFSQYYRLRDVLKRYRGIEKNGGWGTIDPDSSLKTCKPNDSAALILKIRERLFITGDIKHNSKSLRYDPEMVAAINKYQLRNGIAPDSLITSELIREMNVDVAERIKTIVVNMERCRWVSPELFNAKEFIFVNIPSYKLNLIRNGKIEFESPVVVGEVLTRTVIFGGKMSYIVFSPYWNLPNSIIENEVTPGIAKNKNYLAIHNMEWNNGQVRQKPGKHNSLGLVKFMFPNSNDIYFHDAPSRSQFKKDDRALSHGCVRVGKARELAIQILKDDEKWTPQRIDAAMNAGKESIYVLKHKIPVYIGYFTAWVDDNGEINFYTDLYYRDDRLATLLFYKE